ncbi:MAG TPA: DNA polymerase III subunit gamma/tau [Acidobacteriota bacterium]|jgi:DNA polymerase-3 subunit gamma/tau|nr:DNA polymerase III subunit gamma/tau [Acidobacteriota bacterium]
MSYTVIARKWRPQNFEDVVGQKTITQTLQNAIRSKRVAHAFIFSGARGVGKTTTARILARALNCHRGPTAEPCGECVSCIEIAAGNSLDVQEVDAASNRGIDDIRELRDNIKYRPARDRFKIFIIDEVHMLTNEAFNALLKTLEEPPEHVKFIMATTEPHKVPATILSRCQHFEFKMIPYQQILDRLRLIAESEGIQISDYALRLICSASEGSMRDAQSALDQVLAFSGKEVRDEDVRALLGVIAEDLLNTVVDAVIERNRGVLLDQVHEVAAHGHDLRVFCRKLLEHFRHLVVIKAAGFRAETIPVTSSQAGTLQRQVGNFSEIDLLRIYDLLCRAESELRWHPQPLFHLEVTLLKILQLPHLKEIEKLLAGTGSPSPAAQTSPSRSASEDDPAPQTASVYRGFEPVEPARQPLEPDTSIDVDPQLRSLLEAVHQQRPSLSACLDKAQLEKHPGRLVIRFGEKQRFHKHLLEESANLEFLQTQCRSFFGASCTIQVEIQAPAEGVAPAAKTHRALKDPRVQLLTEAFPGKISIEDLEER